MSEEVEIQQEPEGDLMKLARLINLGDNKLSPKGLTITLSLNHYFDAKTIMDANSINFTNNGWNGNTHCTFTIFKERDILALFRSGLVLSGMANFYRKLLGSRGNEHYEMFLSRERDLAAHELGSIFKNEQLAWDTESDTATIILSSSRSVSKITELFYMIGIRESEYESYYSYLTHKYELTIPNYSEIDKVLAKAHDADNWVNRVMQSRSQANNIEKNETVYFAEFIDILNNKDKMIWGIRNGSLEGTFQNLSSQDFDFNLFDEALGKLSIKAIKVEPLGICTSVIIRDPHDISLLADLGLHFAEANEYITKEIAR